MRKMNLKLEKSFRVYIPGVGIGKKLVNIVKGARHE